MSKDFFGNFQKIWFPSYFVKVLYSFSVFAAQTSCGMNGGGRFFVKRFFCKLSINMVFLILLFILRRVCSPDILWDERRRELGGYQRRRNYNQRHQQRPKHTQQVFLNFLKTDFSLFCTSDFSLCCVSYFVFATQQVTTIDSCDAFERNFFSTFETFHKI